MLDEISYDYGPVLERASYHLNHVNANRVRSYRPNKKVEGFDTVGSVLVFDEIGSRKATMSVRQRPPLILA